MDRNYRTTIVAVFLTSLMIGSPIATAVGGASVAPKVDDDSFELTDDVDLWERSAIPLRANTDDAKETLETPNIKYNQSGTEIQSDIEEVGVYRAKNDVRFTFKKRAGAPIADLELNDSNTQVHVVKLDEDVSSDDVDTDDTPDTVEEIRDMLNKEDLNSNATFTDITSKAVSSGYSGGTLKFTHKFPNSGMYAVVVSKHEVGKNGIVLNGKNVSNVDGEVLIGGVETVPVQQARADAGAPSKKKPGKTLTFNANANLKGVSGDVNHAVAVYRRGTVTSDTVTIESPEDIDNETNISEITLSSDKIGFVSGVSNVSDDFTLLGETLEAREDNGKFSAETIVSRIATEANTSEPTIEEGENILNASATALVGPDSTTVRVETLKNWRKGTYQYVYIASGDDSTKFSTDVGTIKINPNVNNNNNNDGGGGGGVAAPPTENPPTLPDEEEETDDGDAEEEAPDVDDVREELEQTEPRTRVSAPIEDSDPDTPGVTVTPEGTETVSRITFNDENVQGTVDISEYDPTDTVSRSIQASFDASDSSQPDSPRFRVRRVHTLVDITPPESANGPATITKTIPAENVDDPDDLVMLHERGNSWERYRTSVTVEEDGTITVSSETDSFSLFAVAEVSEESQTDDVTEEETGGGPGPAVIIGVLVVLALIAAVAFAYSNQDDNEL